MKYEDDLRWHGIQQLKCDGHGSFWQTLAKCYKNIFQIFSAAIVLKDKCYVIFVLQSWPDVLKKLTDGGKDDNS